MGHMTPKEKLDEAFGEALARRPSLHVSPSLTIEEVQRAIGTDYEAEFVANGGITGEDKIISGDDEIKLAVKFLKDKYEIEERRNWRATEFFKDGVSKDEWIQIVRAAYMDGVTYAIA